MTHIVKLKPFDLGPIHTTPKHTYEITKGQIDCIYKDYIYHSEHGQILTIPKNRLHFCTNFGRKDLKMKLISSVVGKHVEYSHRILIFGGFSSPPKLYDNLVNLFMKHSVAIVASAAKEKVPSISVEFIDWMNEKEGDVIFDPIRNITLVCHSMGCQAGLNFYSKHKSKVNSIVLFDYHPFTHEFPDPPKKDMGLIFFPECADNSAKVMKEVEGVMRPTYFSYFTKKYSNQTVPSDIPVLLVSATDLQHIDGKLVYTCVNPRRKSHETEILDNVSTVYISNSNHFWFMENLPKYSRHLSKIWKQIVFNISD
jgi:hypothetical protein